MKSKRGQEIVEHIHRKRCEIAMLERELMNIQKVAEGGNFAVKNCGRQLTLPNL